MVRSACVLFAAAALLIACQNTAPEAPQTRPTISSNASIAGRTPTPQPSRSNTENKWVTARPSWLGRRVLPLTSTGFGQVRPTPPILRNRRFPTIDILDPPDSERFVATIDPVPLRVARRSSWRAECPLSLEELSYLTMSFWGFDREVHTGEMVVNSTVARDVVGAFERLFEIRFPIEEMRVVTAREVDEWQTKPTGDVNVTSSFECRNAAETTHWSMHSYGLAIDINPFHNPYSRGDLVAPELASVYVDRTWRRPGMIFEGGQVTAAFDAIGWGWGGRWNSLKDWMHFSQNGH